MHDRMIALCGMIGAVGGWIASSLGGWDNAVITLVIFMAVDFVLGLLCAALWGKSPKSENGALSSVVCCKGIVKKCGTLCIVMVAHYTDLLLVCDYFRNAVIIGFCVAELISICETAGIMGILPEAVKNVLDRCIDVLKNISDKDGD